MVVLRFGCHWVEVRRCYYWDKVHSESFLTLELLARAAGF